MDSVVYVLQQIYNLLLKPKPLRKYALDFVAYSKTQQVTTNCNSFQIINIGTSNVTVSNSLVLITNQTFTSEGNENEIITDPILITFDNTGTNNCVVVRKNYL